MKSFTAGVLLLAVIFPALAAAKDKDQVQVMEVYTLLQVRSGNQIVPGTPETSETKCTGISGIYSRVYGSTCTTTTNPAVAPHSEYGISELHFYNGLKVIMSDGSHLLLACDRVEKQCGPLINNESADVKKSCDDQSKGTEYGTNDFCTYTPQAGGTFGFFRAKRVGNVVTLWGANGKVTYEVFGTF